MRIHRLILVACCLALTTVIWAKDKVTPQSMMAKSDTLYYYPPAHGLTDLAVTLEIDELAQNPIAKNARITYYYAGEGRERIEITGIPDTEAALRETLLSAVTRLSQFLVPQTTAKTFAGTTPTMKKIGRQIIGIPETSFYLLSGTHTPPVNGVKTFSVLLDARGLLHQIEMQTQESNIPMIANVENVQLPDGWHIAGLTTRVMMQEELRWKIEHVSYTTVDGFQLPERYTLEFRNQYNALVPGLGDFRLTFRDYRLNKGVAAAALAAAEGAKPAPVESAPAKP